MKNYLVLYYSKTGNNKFVAQKIAEGLSAYVEEVRPVLNFQWFQLLLSMMGISAPGNVSQKKLNKFDEVVVIGPIWVGKLLAPLKGVLKKCAKCGKPVHFVTCCGASDEERDNTFGYNGVFEQAKNVSSTLQTTGAVPVPLAIAHKVTEDKDATIKVRLSEENFNEVLRKRIKVCVLNIAHGESVISV